MSATIQLLKKIRVEKMLNVYNRYWLNRFLRINKIEEKAYRKQVEWCEGGCPRLIPESYEQAFERDVVEALELNTPHIVHGVFNLIRKFFHFKTLEGSKFHNLQSLTVKNGKLWLNWDVTAQRRSFPAPFHNAKSGRLSTFALLASFRIIDKTESSFCRILAT